MNPTDKDFTQDCVATLTIYLSGGPYDGQRRDVDDPLKPLENITGQLYEARGERWQDGTPVYAHVGRTGYAKPTTAKKPRSAKITDVKIAKGSRK